MPFQISIGHSQKDGRRYVLEVHTDAQGEFARLEYLADPDADFNAIAAAREPVLLESSAQSQLDQAIAEDSMPPLRFFDLDGLIARMRELFRNNERERLCEIARWILNRINAGDLTDTQVRTAFGLTAGQYNALKNRITALATALDTVRGARGE
jgi:hypothetical protein